MRTLLASASTLALLAMVPDVAAAQTTTPDECCNGANGSEVVNGSAPRPSILFSLSATPISGSRHEARIFNGASGEDGYQIVFGAEFLELLAFLGIPTPQSSFPATPGLPGQDMSVEETRSFSFSNDLNPFRSAYYVSSNGGAGGGGLSSLLVGLAGDAAPGGDGGQMELSFSGSLLATGDSFHGLRLEANGGRGGTGGLGAGIGGVAGDGAPGGSGGSVSLSLNGNIQTQGERSYGVWARSNGAAGGTGGIGVGIVGDGGDGSVGGRGGDVAVSSPGGTVLTFGDESHGILLESIGGGGGASGVGAGLVAASSQAGAGAHGGGVLLWGYIDVGTYGDDSHAIFGQSVGGGGGSAGASIGLVALGSGGQSAGDGGDVTLNNSGTVFTAGDNSIGIFGQSVGGGGGSGSLSGGLVAIGGDSGNGGNGGTVFVRNGGYLLTLGDESYGVFAQSVGGGGGHGGDSGGLVALGGDTNDGGFGGDVTAESAGSIITYGRAAVGLYAQSIGGGGGAGGSSGGLVALGGDGSRPSYGGRVTVDNTGLIETHGSLAIGILAQSVGGAGGRGGSSGGLVALGGDGTAGANGGNVTVENAGRVYTQGSYAVGIYAESLGGGGGSGGDVGGLVALGGDVAEFERNADCPVGTCLGGSDSSDSFGGDVRVINTGFISTGAMEQADGSFSEGSILGGRGVGSHGIYARSVGGGGGTGGSGGGLVALGGDSTSGGYGGRVLVNNQNSIFTFEDYSSGIYAESLGGGGGEGGSTGGLVALGGNASIGSHGGDVLVLSFSGDHTPDGAAIRTRGDYSNAIFARSIGGGGGSAGATGGLVAVAGDVSMGSGGASDDSQVSLGAYGGDIYVANALGLSTTGDHSSAIWAQSIGGGGGFGGDSGGLISLGGDAAISGYGGYVDVFTSGSIMTSGHRSRGVFAQSLGGGGGEGGSSGGLVSLGGDGSFGSHGGGVRVSVGTTEIAGSIITHGTDSAAIFASSIGGGGGYGGDSGGLVSIGGDAELGGDDSFDAYGGEITVNSYFGLRTFGDSSAGIFARSVGGGGGFGGDSGGLVSLGGNSSIGGAGGDIQINMSGLIWTSGSNSAGIFAESVGGGGGEGGVSGGLVSLGGDGADGGVGGDIYVGTVATSIFSFVFTEGDNSSAIFARSVGGGGGTGGDSGGLVSLGGDATLGGNESINSHGGDIVVLNGVRLITAGDRSDGISARSVGGGGGTAGDSGGVVSLGGDGSVGGYGGAVTVFTAASIETRGDRSNGIRAESTGGGGGEGGVSGGLVSLGGDGTFGGYGGAVSVLAGELGASASIITNGTSSRGIFARSIGGGGGDGGDSGGLISLGGDGDNGTDDCADQTDTDLIGCGNFGGTVDVTSYFSIKTNGSDSDGIHAESIGGGGGTAGDSGGIVSLGGDGGTSGFGGDVTVNAHASINASGARSSAIFAQSIGGGGGTILDTDFDIDEGEAPDNGGEGGEGGVCGGIICLGGDGVAGGYGGSVDVTVATLLADGSLNLDSTGFLATNGNDASAIFAQSIGGGGGDGGESGAIVSLGGDGGEGSRGGDVSVTNTFRISTGFELDEAGAIVFETASDDVGVNSDGIFARSIGGGGGDAGDSGGLVSLGGTGDADGINGGGVTVHNNGSIFTGEAYSRGIYAESIGGGGGDGGVSGGLVSIGGDGSAGGYGGSVEVINGFDADGVFAGDLTGAIVTYGKWSDSILARSVGGGGGTGGDNGGFISLGGDGNLSNVGGSADADGGNVTVFNGFNLETHGDHSRGIYAESVGGGGGDGGDAYGAFPFLAIAIGGEGGASGKGGEVRVEHAGDITTRGFQSTAIFAQSIGGSGGNGGVAYTGSAGAFFSASIAIGGDGGTAADGGLVDVVASGHILTLGNQSSGVFAQSIGGGGGSAGKAVAFAASGGDVGAFSASFAIGGKGGVSGDGNSVRVESTSDITTHGFQSHGINAQSVGGGGGSGGAAIAVSATGSGGPSVSAGMALGGAGGAGGNGGQVTVRSSGNIITGGENVAADPEEFFDPEKAEDNFDQYASVGIFAQSVGGGGGEGGMALTGTVAVGTSVSAGLSLSLGGKGGAAGSGDTVRVEQSGNITTRDHFGGGILAQSIGGGGGRAGMAGAAGLSVGSAGIQAGLNMGGTGGGGGNGGVVVVETTGAVIETFGQFSTGIEAQSIGGGGGSGGQTMSGSLAIGAIPVDVLTSLGGSGGFGGNGNAVSVDNESAISTHDLLSHGILAQSIGGGGGNAGSSSSFGATFGKFGGSLAVNLGGDCDAPDDESDEPVLCSGGDSARFGDDTLAGVPPGFGLATGFSNDFESISLANIGELDGTTSTAVVHVKNTGLIVTRGAGSNGIFAQSVGGGGGSGGAAYTGSLSITKASGNVSVSLGGDGGYGGDGGNVFVSHSGVIRTEESFANAIVAQSIGGGGGNGGISLAGTIGITGSGGGAMSVSLGGSGGTAGSGGDVMVDATAGGVMLDPDTGLMVRPSLRTAGHFANGIFAQSVGGGGGNGGLAGSLTIAAGTGQNNAGLGVTLGGDGAGGGTGGVVNVEMGEGAILTSGYASNAIFAQSLGGGGGNGGASFTGGLTIGKGSSAQVGVTLGGTGGAGNAGDFVSVSNQADLRTGSTDNLRIDPGLDPENGIFNSDGDVTLTAVDPENEFRFAHRANGIFAQSVGGGGGNGGIALTAAIAVGGTGGGGLNSAAVGVSLGGGVASGDEPGYTAAVGGDVWVGNSGTIATRGAQSNAILAQSLGGGGGNGGWSGSFTGVVANDFSASASLSFGGKGGSGNRGGEVRVENSAAWMYTNGDDSHGIFASSTGGGGGNGGMALGGAFGKGDGLNLALSFGGNGGDSGAGGDVAVSNSGAILTDGDTSSAIFAQSLGGGGGNGGLTFAGTISASEGKSFSFAFGGDGGSGNSGGAVSVLNSGFLLTRGEASHAIFAQSLGGGGGNGATSITGGLVRTGNSNSINFGLSVGGTGGSSDNVGSAVGVENTGYLVTTGEGAHGVFAQSIGGGGGNGGMAISAAVANTRNGNATNLQATVGVGGGGGTGGVGGEVTVDHSGGITTTGQHSIGIFAQSIGGGGGTAGGANSVSFQLGRYCPENTTNAACKDPANDSRNLNFQMNFGGTGGSGNHGGAVTVTSGDAISTRGTMSHGILAQSVGGGGGEGGDASQGIGGLLPKEVCLVEQDEVGPSGDTTSDEAGSDFSDGCVPGEYISIGADSLLELIDDSGASDADDLGKPSEFVLGAIQNWSIGGSGGASGDGKSVTVDNAGAIVTDGLFSIGIIAQSVGGGGGVAGSSAAGAGFSFGGTGGASGDSGQVSVRNRLGADILTTRNRSVGILAQSVGGGGGLAAHAGTFLARDQWPEGYEAPEAAGGGDCEGIVCVGGDGGAQGDAGYVIVENDANITTGGKGAHGILAQAVGGGGGSFNFGILDDFEERSGAYGAGATGYVLAIGGRGGAGGDGGRADHMFSVEVENTGQITTFGEFAHGVMAQSIGGGGGNGGVQSDDEPLTYTREGFVRSILGDALDRFTDFGTLGLVNLGGNGGNAGRGYNVRVENAGTIHAYGLGSNAILAQSVGGGGGEATASLGAMSLGSVVDDLVEAEVDLFQLLLDRATGRESSQGGNVEVSTTADSAIRISGVAARGIFAQSVGAGGGIGGAAIDDFVLGADSPIRGSGGNVSVDNAGDILAAQSTEDGQLLSSPRNARGIQAQSIGGGGGSVMSPLFETVNTGAPDITGQLGGEGWAALGGGDGGAVSVRHQSDAGIQMNEAGSIGILAQSVGGGGGDFLAEFGSLDVTLGGLAGVQGSGGSVFVESCGTLSMREANSVAVIAQSVGGGGGLVSGNAGNIDSLLLGGQREEGDGTAESDGGTVGVTQCGDIYLGGDASVGIFAQSVGGGGGAVLPTYSVGSFTQTYGSGGVGSGGSVLFALTEDANIYAAGDNVFGVVLQSVGGGGGWSGTHSHLTAGGLGDGDGGGVSFTILGDVITTGENSTAIFAQSAGGSAGSILGTIDGYVRGGSGSGAGLMIAGGGNNLVSIGDSGVLSAISGRAIVSGDGNDAIVNAGLIAGGVDLGAGENSFVNSESGLHVAIGDLILVREVEVEPGAEALAAIAPSVVPTVKSGHPPVMEALNHGANPGGGASIVQGAPIAGSLEPSGGVESGRAPLVIAGQNGLGAVDTIMAPVGKGSPVMAELGAVPVNSASPAASPAIEVAWAPGGQMSVAGSTMASSIGSVSGMPVDHDHVRAADEGSAIKAAPPPVMATIDSAQIQDSDSPALYVSAERAAGSVDKRLVAPVMDADNERGASGGPFQDDAPAIAAVFPMFTTDFDGRQRNIGSPAIDLDRQTPVALSAAQAPAGSYTNAGTFFMGLSASDMPIDLAAGDRFEDLVGFGDDAFNLLAGAQVINTIHVDGDFIQTDTGHLVFDAAFGPYGSDQIIVSGDATVAGTGEVTLTWLENAEPVPLFVTGGVGVYDGLDIADSAAIDYTVTVGADGVFLNIETDFGVMFSGENGRALGAAMDAAVLAGEAQSLGRLLAMFGNMDTAGTELTQAIGEELNPEAHIAPMHILMGIAEAVDRDIFSCDPQVSGSDGASCVWTEVSRSSYEREGSADSYSVSRRGARFAGGFEQRLGDNWTRAVTLGFDHQGSMIIDGGRAVGDGQSLSMGFGVRRLDASGLSFGANMATGWSWGDLQRRVSVFQSGVGESEYQTGFMRLGGHISHRFGGEGAGFFAQPRLGVSATALRHNGLIEDGLSGFGIGVDADTQWIATATPELTIGHAFGEERQSAVLSMTLGARFASENELDLPIRFEGTSQAAEAVDFGTSLTELYSVSTQLRVIDADGFSVDLSYRSDFNDDVRRASAGVDLRWRF